MGIRIGLVALVILTLGTTRARAVGFLDSWRATTPLPYLDASHTSVSYQNHIYVMGGNANYGYSNDRVIRATSGALGELSSWDDASARMPYAPIFHSSIAYNKFVYALGGKEENVGSARGDVNKVFLGVLDANGVIQSWTQQASLFAPTEMGATWVYDDNLFYAGGATGNVNPVMFYRDIYKARIDPESGTLEEWKAVGLLPEPVTQAAGVAIGKYVYIIGGVNPDVGITDKVWKGEFDDISGSYFWTQLPSLPSPIDRAQSGAIGNRVIIVGGGKPGNLQMRKSYYFEVDGEGNFSEWKEGAELPIGLCCGAMALANGYAYITGGFTEYGGYSGAVYVSEVGPHTGDPTPTLTPTPAPTSVPKVVIVPGMMASWNADAILNCKLEGYEGEWTLAPFAGFAYKPLLKSLTESGAEVIPFYYDWRAKIATNGARLKTFVDSMTPGDGKIDLVGHSMGGLVSRAYMGFMGVNKVKNLVTAGSPHYGVPSAYPAWAAGEIWNDGLVQQIATTLLMKSCSDKLHQDQRETLRRVIPSIQDLLPVFPYLRNGFLGGLKDINGMQIKNGWLVDPFFDITTLETRIMTLGGTGKPTIGEIVVIDPSPYNVLNGDWADGRPVRWVKARNGDGTVLIQSALLPGSTTRTIQKDHVGVVNSAEAISIIMGHLGLGDGVPALIQFEPKSALVVAVYPGEFLVEDADGGFVDSENGVVAIFDPRQIGRKIILDKLGVERVVMIGRFMESGEYSWERKMVGGKSGQMIPLSWPWPGREWTYDDSR